MRSGGHRAAFRAALAFVVLLGCVKQSRAELVFITSPDVGDFVPNSATPEFLAAIGGAPDEFISFAVDKAGLPLGNGLVLGNVFSDNVVFSTKASPFGPDSPFVERFADNPFVQPNAEEIGPAPGFNGILNIDFLAAGQTASAVGFGTVEFLESESIRIYDQNNVLIATQPGVSNNIFSFFGVLATGPEQIGRIELDGTFLAIQDLQFKLTVVPEPSALGLLALGTIGLLAWRRLRS
jgi:hypothetical protein